VLGGRAPPVAQERSDTGGLDAFCINKTAVWRILQFKNIIFIKCKYLKVFISTILVYFSIFIKQSIF
jgi:hypothetical protein